MEILGIDSLELLFYNAHIRTKFLRLKESRYVFYNYSFV